MRPDAEIEWLELPQLPSPWQHFLLRVASWFTGEQSHPDKDDYLWDSKRSLYALVHPQTGDLLYIGKAWTTTVYRRVIARDKKRVYDVIREEAGLSPHEVFTYVGSVQSITQRRLTRALLEEIESLLIFHTCPCGNHASKASYRCRKALTVRCTGDWPLRQKTYMDEPSADR